MMMRFTVDIDDKLLKDLKRFARTRKKSPAVNRAVEDFVHRQKVEELINRVNSGEVDFEPVYQNFKRQREYDARRNLRVD
jgi:predicted transcriptional regulator